MFIPCDIGDLNIRQVLCYFNVIFPGVLNPKFRPQIRRVREYPNHIKHNIYYHASMVVQKAYELGGFFHNINTRNINNFTIF